MDVRDIIDTMVEFSAGGSNSSAEFRALCLRYLTMAYQELYARTAHVNPEAILTKYWSEPDDFGHKTAFDDAAMDVVSVDSVLRPDKPLTKVSVAVGIKHSLLNTSVTMPYDSFAWERTGQEDGTGFNLLLYPFVKDKTKRDQLVVSFIRESPVLHDRMDGRQLLFPETFHPSLVDGGLFYVFQEEGGFKDSLKAREAKMRWEAAKQRIGAFFANSGS